MSEAEKILKVDIEGKPHEAIAGVSVFRTRKNEKGESVREVLLVRGENSGQWYFPGGKIREGEDPVVALRREMQEELGVGFSGELRAREGSAGQYHFGGKYRSIANFTLEEPQLVGEPKIQNKENVVEFGWFSGPNVPKNLTFQAQAALEEQMPDLRR